MLLRQAKVINPSSSFHGQSADILIKEGRIAAIAAEIENTDGVREVSLPGLTISSGWVDLFADYCEPGYEHKETMASGLEAARAGGFTDVLLLPNTNPSIDNKSGVQALRQRAAGHAVQVHPLGAISREIAGKALAEMMDMRAHGAIAFTDGWQPVQNGGLLLKALEYVKAFNGILIQMPVDAALAAGGLMHEGETSTRLGMPGIPALAETLMVHRDIELVRYTGSRLHITGISSAESVALIRAAKKEGLDITCSVTPYHLALNDEALLHYNSLYKVTPPIRTEADRQALMEGLGDGTIDCIASHHHPQDWDAKSKEFEYAGTGMNVQEMVFPIVWNAVKGQVILDRVMDALSTRARTIFNLPDAGNDTSFTIFTTEQNSIFRKQDLKSKGMNNPFLEQELQGKVLYDNR